MCSSVCHFSRTSMYRKSTEKRETRYFRPKSKEELVFCTSRTAPNDLCETRYAPESCLCPSLRVCPPHASRSRQRSSILLHHPSHSTAVLQSSRIGGSSLQFLSVCLLSLSPLSPSPLFPSFHLFSALFYIRDSFPSSPLSFHFQQHTLLHHIH